MRALLTGIALGWLLAAPALGCPHIPPLGTAIDGLLKQTNLTEADLKKVEDLRKQTTELAAAGKEQDARKAEEEAMRLLGFEKAWLKCGPGTFMWMKIETAATPAPASKQ
jgi:hypothetical protein